MRATKARAGGAALLLLSALAEAPAARATATCFCKISSHDLGGQTQGSGVCMDLTGQVGRQFTGLYQQSEENQNLCRQLCAGQVKNLVKSQAVANACCAAGAANLSSIAAWSAVGTKAYRKAQSIDGFDSNLGTLIDQPVTTVTTCHCPNGWVSNSLPQVNAGLATDGKCKRRELLPLSTTPLPPDGTPIGTWGFTWGTGVYAWGTAANGGAAQGCHLVGIGQVSCTCPAGWISNTSQVNGGITLDQKCKKQDLNPLSITPLPPDGTQIGSWGFTWGNGLSAWGNTANGGAPNCTTQVTHTAFCGFL